MGHTGKKLKGWFATNGRPGDRTLESQLLGLDKLFDECQGETVLDVGCAEGLLSIELARNGAVAVHGVEVRFDHVGTGRKLVGDLPVTIECADANVWQPRRKYGIVLALAVLHKLRRPDHAAARLADACKDLMVLRMPPATGMTIVDSRSGGRPYDIDAVLKTAGFEPELITNDGPFGELVAYYRRKA
jgi:SAM-dependent methyltransferase